MTSPVPHLSHKAIPVISNTFLTAPIPPISTIGQIRVLNARQIKSGEKITIVSAAGVFYEYFATSDIQVVDSTTPGYADIPVLPAMQATHAVFDKVYLANDKRPMQRGLNAIGDIRPFSAYGKPDGESNTTPAQCVPHLRSWPWSTDIHGIPYDQSNILALSFYQVQSAFVATKELNNIWDYSTSPPTLTGSNIDYGAYARTDEERNLIAVPKTIPLSTYTALTPRQIYSQVTYQSIPRGGYYGGMPASAYGVSDACRFYRTATDNKNRSITLSPTKADWLAQSYQQVSPAPLTGSPHNVGSGVGFYPAEDPATKIMANFKPFFATPGLTNTFNYGCGSRGGTYSIQAIGYNGSGFFGQPSSACTIEIWMTRPGQSDIMLASLSFPARSLGDPYTVQEGTWSGVQAPTANGTCCQLYAKGYCVDTIVMSDPSKCTVMPSTQVPYVFGITTGNLVAPGGLIAPFY